MIDLLGESSGVICSGLLMLKERKTFLWVQMSTSIFFLDSHHKTVSPLYANSVYLFFY